MRSLLCVRREENVRESLLTSGYSMPFVPAVAMYFSHLLSSTPIPMASVGGKESEVRMANAFQGYSSDGKYAHPCILIH